MFINYDDFVQKNVQFASLHLISYLLAKEIKLKSWYLMSKKINS